MGEGRPTAVSVVLCTSAQVQACRMPNLPEITLEIVGAKVTRVHVTFLCSRLEFSKPARGIFELSRASASNRASPFQKALHTLPQ